jgi:hypothetical protein
MRVTFMFFMITAVATALQPLESHISQRHLRGLKSANQSTQVDICLYDENLGQFKKISIRQKDLKKHIGKHGPATGNGDMNVTAANALEGSNNCA